jgi:hypothetical protein
VEKRRVLLSVTGSETNVGVVWYRNYAVVNFLTPFPTTPMLELTATIESSAVQHVQVFSVTASGFQVRGTRLYAAGVANALATYTATEVL